MPECNLGGESKANIYTLADFWIERDNFGCLCGFTVKQTIFGGFQLLDLIITELKRAAGTHKDMRTGPHHDCKRKKIRVLLFDGIISPSYLTKFFPL